MRAASVTPLTRNVPLLVAALALLPLAASPAAGDPGVRVHVGEHLWVRVEKPANLLPTVTTSVPSSCQTTLQTPQRVTVRCDPAVDYGTTVNPLLDAPGPLTEDSQVQECGGIATSHAASGQVWGYLYCGSVLSTYTMDDASQPELELPTDALGIPSGVVLGPQVRHGPWPLVCDVDFANDAGWVVCQNADGYGGPVN